MSAVQSSNGVATDATIAIDKIQVEALSVPILGTSPLIVHRFSEKAKRQMLDAMQGRKTPKESKDPQAEYEAAFYRFPDEGYGFPVVAFKAATVDASRFYGKSVTKVGLRQFLFMRGEVGSDGQQLARITGEPHMREDPVTVGRSGRDLRYRPEFPILERTTYMISNSLGAMPRAVYDALKGYADTWATRGVRAWEETWWMLASEVGDEIGALMNAPKGSVSTHQNVTTCQAIIASCLDFSGKRNKVVYTDLNFPSVMYFWEAQRASGARVNMVKTDDGIHVPTERLLLSLIHI